MAFFEPPPPPPEPPAQPPRRPWHGPPEATMGGTLALGLVIGRSDKAAVWIPALSVYADGFEFEVEIRHRLDEDMFPQPFFMRPHMRQRRASADEGELPADLLRLGIELADGRKATNLGMGMPFPLPGETEEAPEGPLLVPSGGGGGGGGRWRHGYYCWPLPPEGPLAFVCEWPIAEIALTRAEIDSELVRAAARDAVVLWDTGDRPPGLRASLAGHSTFQTLRAVRREPSGDEPPGDHAEQ